jgi:ribonuclease HIII
MYVAVMTQKTSFSFKLTPAEQTKLTEVLSAGNYREAAVPYTSIAVRGDDCGINLYNSGKCLVQGKGAEEFVTFVLEPYVLKRVVIGYDEVLDPQASQPHMGVDESGKGDFFGPIVIVAAYVNPDLAKAMKAMDVRDSKTITSDDKAMGLGGELRRMLGRRFSTVKIGPVTYNRLYTKMRSVNTMLAWAHARAIENLLEAVPDCPRAISDQFGKKEQVERALMQKGRKIELIQMPKAESDIAVAAASIIARDLFLRSLRDFSEKYGIKFPKGASAQVREVAVELAKARGPEILMETAKCHFKTTDQVLAAAGTDRSALGPDGQAVSKPFKGNFRRKKS